MCEDLRKILINKRYLSKYKITDMKEKYGNLSISDNGHFEEMDDIITKYEMLSEYICCDCGKPDVSLVNSFGYVQPLCRNCLEKRIIVSRRNGLSINNGMTYETLAYRQENNQKMPDKIVIKHFKNGVEYPEIVDCTAEINKIRSAYKNHRQAIDYVCGIDIK